MKRDLDYIRNFLLECEANEDFRFSYEQTGYFEGAMQEVLPFGWDVKKLGHYELLEDEGFVIELDDDFPPHRDDGSAICSVRKFRITQSGHDYLDVIRDEGIWGKTKKAVAETGGSVALEIIKTLATGFLKQKLSKHTGIKL